MNNLHSMILIIMDKWLASAMKLKNLELIYMISKYLWSVLWCSIKLKLIQLDNNMFWCDNVFSNWNSQYKNHIENNKLMICWLINDKIKYNWDGIYLIECH